MEGPAGYSDVSRSVEGGGLHPASGKGGNGCEGIAGVLKSLAEEDEVVREVVRVRAQQALCAQVQAREAQGPTTDAGDVLVEPGERPAEQQAVSCERV